LLCDSTPGCPNPTLSAAQFEVQRNPAGLLRKLSEMGAVLPLVLWNQTAEIVLACFVAFLEARREQTGFS
jgi:hypothetical protein